MQNIIILADKYMELISQKQTSVPVQVTPYLTELHLKSFIKARLKLETGVYYELNTEYFNHVDELVEDVAFLVQMFQGIKVEDLFDAEGMGNFIMFVAGVAKVEFESFSNRVVAKVKEYSTIERDMVCVVN